MLHCMTLKLHGEIVELPWYTEKGRTGMADQIPPSNQDIDKWMREMPNSILDQLPDVPKRKDARGHIHEAARLAHEIREEAQP